MSLSIPRKHHLQTACSLKELADDYAPRRLKDALEKVRSSEMYPVFLDYDIMEATWENVAREFHEARQAADISNVNEERFHRNGWRHAGSKWMEHAEVLMEVFPSKLGPIKGALAFVFSVC